MKSSQPAPSIMGSVNDLTPEWLAHVLGVDSVSDLLIEPLGTGMMAEMLRVQFDSSHGHGTPTSVILKFTADDADSRSFASSMHMYELEVLFYREVVPRLPGASVPHCYHAALDEATSAFTLVLEDLSPTTRPGNVLVPCTAAECVAVVDELVLIQAATWNSPEYSQLTWLADPVRTTTFFEALPAGLDLFVKRFGAKLAGEHLNLFRAVLPQANEWVKRWRPPTVLQHGDFRSDNILFGANEDATVKATMVDFQTIRLGPPGFDLAYFIGSSLSIEDRRAAEVSLVNRYHRQLLEAGVEDFDAEECWAQYCAGAMYGILLFAGASCQVAVTERAVRYITDQAARYAQMALDLHAPEVAGFTY